MKAQSIESSAKTLMELKQAIDRTSQVGSGIQRINLREVGSEAAFIAVGIGGGSAEPRQHWQVNEPRRDQKQTSRSLNQRLHR